MTCDLNRSLVLYFQYLQPEALVVTPPVVSATAGKTGYPPTGQLHSFVALGTRGTTKQVASAHPTPFKRKLMSPLLFGNS